MGINLKPVLIAGGIFLLPLTIYILYRISISENRLVPFSALAVIIGVLVENKRLTPKWSTVLYNLLFAFVLSFFAFIPGKHESNYSFDVHVFMWPYAFLFFFIILSVANNKEKLIPRLSETNTLILSSGIIYWITDHRYYNTSSVFLKILLVIAFLAALFSAVNALTRIKLSKTIRLTLSIWSSIIMIFLTIDNIATIYQHGEIEDAFSMIDKFNVGLQYFLLGVCSIYIAQNILMVITYLPSRGRFFNSEYYNEVRQMTKDHLDRYSEEQSNISLSLICLIIAATFFIVNYKFDLVHRNTAIWTAFFVLNNIVFYFETIRPVVKGE